MAAAKSKRAISEKSKNRNGNGKKANGNGTPKTNGINNGVNSKNNNGGRTLDKLDRQSKIARLLFVKKKTYNEVAKIVHVSIETVKRDYRHLRDEYIARAEREIKDEMSCVREELWLSYGERIKILWQECDEIQSNIKRIKKLIREIKSEVDGSKNMRHKKPLLIRLQKLYDSQRSYGDLQIQILKHIDETENSFLTKLQKLGVIKPDAPPGINLNQYFGNNDAATSDEEKERELAENQRLIASGNGSKNNRL